jgi:peptidoglycan/xylan/chitin deacetylase (PgdA/CDA1 family)
MIRRLLSGGGRPLPPDGPDRGWGWARRAAAWATGLIALPLSVLPFYLYGHYDRLGQLLAMHVERRFSGPELATLGPAETVFFQRNSLVYRDGLIVLLFHGVMDGHSSSGENPEDTTIATRRFGEDMQMLKAAGFTTVSVEQVDAWMHQGGRLPRNAVLLTFDDGRADAMLNAPPILSDLGMRASVFLIGGGYPEAPVYYASPDLLRGLTKKGWSIQAHAVDGHQSVAAGDGRRLPYMAALRWAGGQQETIDGFRARIRTELRAARDAAGSMSALPAVAYAWPFGAYGADTRTNDPRIEAIDLEEARAAFPLVFTVDDQETLALVTRATDPGRIPRLRVDPGWTALEFWRRLQLLIAATAPEVSHAG